MFSPFRGLEVGHDQFETLCLKASPASLQVLCRSAVRANLSYCQKSIKQLTRVIPKSLVDFVKYPSHLRVGEFMLRDEKLVDENDRYELAIDSETGDLVCNSLVADEEGRRMVVARNVDLIALHRFNAVFFNKTDGRAFTQHSIYENLLGYKFFVEWEVSNTYVRVF